MDRRMAIAIRGSRNNEVGPSSSSSFRSTRVASRHNSETFLINASHLKNKDEKKRRHPKDAKDERSVRRVSRERELKKKDESQGDRILANECSSTSKSEKSFATTHVADRGNHACQDAGNVTFDSVDPQWAAAMNERYGLEGQESPFTVVSVERKREQSPSRQPKRTDETPPPSLPKLPSTPKPTSDPYEIEDEDPATAALRKEIRVRDEELHCWISANLNEPLFLTLLQDKMDKRKKMVDRLEELKNPLVSECTSVQKDEYAPRFESRGNRNLEFGQSSGERRTRGNDRRRSNKSADNSSRKSNPNKEEVGGRCRRDRGREKRSIDRDGDVGVETNTSEIDWKKLKLENEEKRKVDYASQMDARNRLTALAGGYVTATGEAVDSPLEPEPSTSSGFGGRPLNHERSWEDRFQEAEIVELDSDDEKGCSGKRLGNLSSEDLLAVHGIRVVEQGEGQRQKKKVDPLIIETIVLSDEAEDEWEEKPKESEQAKNVEVEETEHGEEDDPATLSLDAPDIEEELNNS